LGPESLKARGILVTRPREQAAGIARLIEDAGGRALLFPAIEIEDLPRAAVFDRLREFQLAVFVSPTAVSRALRHVAAWPAGLRAAAVGGGTRRELERHGIANVIAPESGADSEALLALPELGEVAGKRVAIFRGEDGRALLGDTLKARGAHIEYVACYRRKRPHPPFPEVDRKQIAAILVSSAEGLENLFTMLDPALLRSKPLFVPHARVAEAARAKGAHEVMTAGASDAEMLDALVAYFRSHG
jgi:uroporphyrinogen-III synthase